MILKSQNYLINLISVPRVGGGDPPKLEFILDKLKCSPRRRG